MALELYSMIGNMPADAGMPKAGFVCPANAGSAWQSMDVKWAKNFLKDVPQGGVVSLNTEDDPACAFNSEMDDDENEMAVINIARHALWLRAARKDARLDLNVMPDVIPPRDPWRHAGSNSPEKQAARRKIVSLTHRHLVPLFKSFSKQVYFHRKWQDMDHNLFGQVRDVELDNSGKPKRWPGGKELRVYRGETDGEWLLDGGWVDYLRSAVEAFAGFGLPVAIYFNPTYEYLSRPSSLRAKWIAGQDQEEVIKYLDAYGCPVFLWTPYVVPVTGTYKDGMKIPNWKDSADEGPWDRWVKAQKVVA